MKLDHVIRTVLAWVCDPYVFLILISTWLIMCQKEETARMNDEMIRNITDSVASTIMTMWNMVCLAFSLFIYAVSPSWGRFVLDHFMFPIDLASECVENPLEIMISHVHTQSMMLLQAIRETVFYVLKQ